MTTKALMLAIGLGAFLVAGPVNAGTPPDLACKESKAKGSGKKAFDLLKALGKNIKKPDGAKLGADISKAESKFTKAFTKAEDKGGCLTTADSVSIEQKVNLTVCRIVDSVGPATCGNNCAGVGEECDGTDADKCITGLCIPFGDPNECKCQGCGDGILIGGEECDEGTANGTPGSCCELDCTLKAASTACTDTDGNVCTTAGCDGVNGACDQNHIFAPDSDPCPDTDGNVCTIAGCDGAGNCDQGHTPAPASDPCPDTDGNVCTAAGCDGAGVCDQGHILAPFSDPCPDTDANDCTTAGCDGAGVCDQAHVYVPASTPCTTAPDLICANPGCDGAGVCDPLHLLEPASVECRASAGVCDPAENCDGVTGDCPADGKSTAECRASQGVCDPAESCDGVNDDCPADGKSTAECRASAGVCDPAESCDGVNDDCPADGKSTAECRASAGVCDLAESCDGVNDDCPGDGKSTAECRPVAGDCDVAESCDGVGNDCPVDGFLPGSTECRASAGVCDPAENCTGSSAACPADGKSTAECRASAGVCDLAESCDGVGNDCPADGKSTAECRASAGVCDPAESCDGVGNDCPADGKSTAECRPVADVCDVAESCDGVNDDCPVDGFEPGTTECRGVAGVCDVAENCTGSSAACPADGFLPGSTECRASAGVCDPAENCTGSGPACPADGKSTAECRASAGVCDPAESCDGVNDACPADGKSTAECRASAGVCDLAESCDGVNNDCPADGKSTAECRAVAGVCDAAESCDGVGNDCPADGFLPGSTECRADAGECDVAENCTGSSADCPADGFEPGSTSCTDSDGNVCTTAGCDGAGGCDQGHISTPASTTCPDTDGEVCTIAGCDGAGTCDQDHVFASSSTLCQGGVGACSTEHCDGAGTCVNESRCCAGLDCSGGSCDLLSFETGIPSGTSGYLRNFRCSNNSSAACVDDSDCDLGTCLFTPPFCWDGVSLGPPCTQHADCQGTCAEVTAGNLPLALERGGLYTGGGLNSVPLPFPVPDQGLSYTSVTDCNSSTGALTLGPSTPGQVGQRHCTQGRTCTGGTNDGLHCVLAGDCPGGTCTDNCIFGPPLPIPNSGTPATSVCTKNVIDLDASGTAECDGGDSDLTQPLRTVIYLNGDLFKASTPPDIPGVQPCPLCDTLCVGGTKADFPCDDDSECPGGTCNTSYECLGGPNDGAACTPATSDSAALGDSQGAYPTSHDCQNDPLASITDNIGGLPINFALTTGAKTVDAVDRAQGKRNFCGFCRDVTGESSLCFEGDARPTCPNGSDPQCQPQGGLGDISHCGNAVQCEGDGDCSAPYESCVQRDPGAFSEAAATRITVAGATDGGCLGDNALHPAELVAIFCIPPTFDTTVDAAGDLPGPGTALLAGEAQLD